MSVVRASLIGLGLLGLTLLPLAAQAGAGRTTAREMVDTLEGNVSWLGKVVKDARLGGEPRLKPFLLDLRELSRTLDALEAAVELRSPETFPRIHEVGLLVASLRSALAASGVRDQRLADGLAKLESAYRVFRKNFGKEGARLRDGGTLTAAETREYERLRAQNQKLAERLATLESQVGRNAALQAEVRALRDESSRLARLPLDLAGYLAAVALAQSLTGRWYGVYDYVRVVDPAWALYFNPVATDWVVWNDLTIETYDLITWDATDWAWYDDPVDVTWDLDYTVDLSTTDVETYEEYVEETMVVEESRETVTTEEQNGTEAVQIETQEEEVRFEMDEPSAPEPADPGED